MTRWARIGILTMTLIMVAGMAVVPASAAPQVGVSAEKPAAFSSIGPGQSQQLVNCLTNFPNRRHPLAVRLAARANITYEQAVNWLCQGVSPREVLFASRLSAAAGVSIDQIFSYRSQGMSWDQIVGMYDIRNTPFWYDYQQNLWMRENARLRRNGAWWRNPQFNPVTGRMRNRSRYGVPWNLR